MMIVLPLADDGEWEEDLEPCEQQQEQRGGGAGQLGGAARRPVGAERV